MKLDRFLAFFNLRKTLIAVVLGLLLIALDHRFQSWLARALSEKQEELGESLVLLNAKDQVKEKEKEIESFTAMKKNQSEFENWTDRVAPLVAEQKLILRQVRPLGIEERGRVKEEKLFLQVEGNMDGFLGFLHYLASQESPIYVSRYLITTRTAGSGFISVELVLSRSVF